MKYIDKNQIDYNQIVNFHYETGKGVVNPKKRVSKVIVEYAHSKETLSDEKACEFLQTLQAYNTICLQKMGCYGENDKECVTARDILKKNAFVAPENAQPQ